MRTAVPPRQTFGTRATIPPLPSPAPAKTPRDPLIDTTSIKAFAQSSVIALREDSAALAANTAQWLRDFAVYFLGLLKNAHGSRALTPADVANAVPLLPGQTRETLVRFFAYAGGVGALCFFAAHMLRSPTVEASVDLAPRPDWLTIAKPYPAFELTLPDLHEEAHYAILRHPDGNGRKDIVTFGEAGRSLRYAMVEIYRPGRELDQFTSVPSEIAARARELGPAGAVRSALPLESKFGPVATVEFTVGRFGVGHCIGFVRAETDPKLQISGLSCSMNAIVNRKAVACMLDRLTLLSAGSDPDIARYFAQAEIKRDFCGQRDPILYATPKRDYPPNAAPAVGLRR
jgi:hypothetical protein